MFIPTTLAPETVRFTFLVCWVRKRKPCVRFGLLGLRFSCVGFVNVNLVCVLACLVYVYWGWLLEQCKVLVDFGLGDLVMVIQKLSFFGLHEIVPIGAVWGHPETLLKHLAVSEVFHCV